MGVTVRVNLSDSIHVNSTRCLDLETIPTQVSVISELTGTAASLSGVVPSRRSEATLHTNGESLSRKKETLLRLMRKVVVSDALAPPVDKDHEEGYDSDDQKDNEEDKHQRDGDALDEREGLFVGIESPLVRQRVAERAAGVNVAVSLDAVRDCGVRHTGDFSRTNASSHTRRCDGEAHFRLCSEQLAYPPWFR